MYQNYKIMKTQGNFFYFKRNWRYMDTMPKPDSKIYCILFFENKTGQKCEKSNGRELKYF